MDLLEHECDTEDFSECQVVWLSNNHRIGESTLATMLSRSHRSLILAESYRDQWFAHLRLAWSRNLRLSRHLPMLLFEDE